MATAHRFIVELKDGDKLEQEVYLCVRKGVPVDRTGRRYVSGMLADRSGQIEALLWEEAERQAERFSANDFVAVRGAAVQFQGRLQLHLTEIWRADPAAVVAEDYYARAPFDVERAWSELERTLASVAEPHLRALTRQYLDDAELAGLLRAAPAARSIHHAYLGGLLAHTLSVVTLVDLLCAHYREAQPGMLNRDLALAGAFVHDLGKVWEISRDEGFQYTDRGRLLGHIVLGLQALERKLERVPGFPPELADHLRHILLSHHGELEHGSPKRPKTAEALLVHRADELDSQLGALREIFNRTPGQGWTAFQPLFDRYLFHGWPSGTAERPAPAPPPPSD
jgi:3'-5' exoribonuclease